MDIEGLNFEGMNETDVREEFVTPLLRSLGYRSGGTHNVIRELSLRYPRDSLGRKKATDPPLRGKADYICEVDRRIRWVVEAKAPEEELGSDEVEQAYTYARHPEVRAVYFCLTNGRRLMVYRTDESPDSGPVLDVRYEDFPSAFMKVESLLAPTSVQRDFPGTHRDVGAPVAPGLRSLAQIVSGRVTIRSATPDLPQLVGVNHTIVDGTIEHSDDGSLIVYIDLLAPYQSLQDFSRRFSLDRMELRSPSQTMSVDAAEPTVFTASRNLIIPKGERMMDLQSWSYIESPIQLECRAETRALVALNGRRLHGHWSQVLAFSPVEVQIAVEGDFDVRVS